MPVLRKKTDQSLLGVMLACGMPMEIVRANIKLAISGGQNEPRDAIAGTLWALLTHPDQLKLASNAESTSRRVQNRVSRLRELCRRMAARFYRGSLPRPPFGRPNTSHTKSVSNN